MTDNNNTQSPFLESSDQEVKVQPKKKGRPPIPLDEKRRSFVMLRLNSNEIERFYLLKKDRQWTGDDATFARDLILSKRKSQRPAVDLLRLEEVLSAVFVQMPEIVSDAYTDEDRDQVVRVTQALLKDALRVMYSSNNNK